MYDLVSCATERSLIDCTNDIRIEDKQHLINLLNSLHENGYCWNSNKSLKGHIPIQISRIQTWKDKKVTYSYK